MPEIQKADPSARRKAILLTLVAALFGSILIITLQAHQDAFKEWMTRHGDWFIAYPELIAGVFFILLLPVFGFAVYFFRLASRIINARRFPPPGVAVVRDTVVLSGRPAVTRGYLLQFVAGILMLAGLFIPFMMWYIFIKISRGH